MGFFANAKTIYKNLKTLGNVSEALGYLSNPETRSAFQNSLLNGQAAWLTMFDTNNSSGENINPDTAMRVATAFTCINVKSESLSMLPLHVYKKEGKNKVIASDHWAYDLIRTRPNPFMTSKQWMKLITQQRETHGNSYSIITRKRSGSRIDIIGDPDGVEIYDADGEPIYCYKGKDYLSSDILHFKGFSNDGKKGLSTIRYHSETIGALKRLRKFSNRSLSDRPAMYGSSDQQSPMNKTQKDAFKDYWQSEMSDYNTQGKIPVLYNGFELKSIGLSPLDAQYLDQTKSTREDIYGIFNVPPMLAQNYNSGQTYSNAEQQNLVWLTYGLNPIIVDMEQELNYKLFNQQEKNYYTKFNEKALLRTDAKTQSEWLTGLFKIGGYSIDEVRDYIDENPIGDERHWIEGNNMVPTDKVNDILASKNAPKVTPTQKKELKSILNGHFDDVMDILNK